MRLRTVGDGLVAACLLGMVCAPLAVSAATPDALPPAPVAPIPTPPGPAPVLTPLPVYGTPAGEAAARTAVADPGRLEVLLSDAIEAATGQPREPTPLLVAATLGNQLLLPSLRVSPDRLPEVLDLAGLLMVADAHGLLYGGTAAADGLLAQLPDSCSVLLDRLLARAGGMYADAPMADLARAAEGECPGDVTPQVLEVIWTLDSTHEGDPAGPRALAGLARREPLLGLVLEADLLVKRATDVDQDGPFRARRLLTQALRRYDAAAPVLPDADLGAAEALRLLGRKQEAVDRLRALTKRVPHSRLAAERLAEAEEAAGRPDRAAAALADLPPGAGERLFPGELPGQPSDVASAGGSLSLGLLDAAPAQLDRPPVPLAFSGVTVQDFSFVPAWREVPGISGPLRGCPAAQRARAELAAGRVRQAAALHREARCAPYPARFARLLAELGGGDTAAARAAAEQEELELAAPGVALADPLDDLQELQRYTGDLGAAEQTVRRWRERSPREPLPLLRQAELAFLQERWREAAARAGEAARLARRAQERAAALLVVGAAHGVAGRDAQALDALREAEDLLAPLASPPRPAPYEPAVDSAALATQDPWADHGEDPLPEDEYAANRAAYELFEVRLAAGNLLLRAEEFAAAEASFLAATEAYAGTDLLQVAGARPELAQVGRALAALGDGRPEDGLEPARAAVKTDPDNPLFLLDLAFVQRRVGNVDAAERNLRRARGADPRLGVAALDLGTMLAEQGRDEEAEAVLRQAVELEPTSAPGWHTLGVVLERGSPREVLQAQAAFARAARIDKDFRGRQRVPVYDDRIYVSRLDLSKPLPPEWSFSTTEQRLPATALLAAAVVGLVGWLRSKYVGRAVGVVEARGQRALERLSRLPAHLVPAAAVAGTLGVLLTPVVRAGLPMAETATVAVGIGLMLLALVRVRRRFASPEARHVAWTPALVVGVVGSATGLGGYPPVPAAHGTGGDPRVHRAGPLLLFGTGLTLLLVATVTEVPVARVLATSALGMAAVCLTPAGPFDGLHVAAPRALRVTAVIGTAIALGLATGLL